MKTIDTLEVYKKIGIKLFHLTWKKGWNKKHIIGSPKSELICFKGGTPIMLGPKNENHKLNIAKMKFILLSLVYWTF
jgi:hypothetical protein